VVELSLVSAQLQAHAARAYPEECVGAIVRAPSGALEVRALTNVAADPRRAFLLSAKDTLQLAREELLAVYHSHPDGDAAPSREDLEQAWEGTWLVVIPVTRGVAGEPSVTWVNRGPRGARR
jgi:proteasome lid subunit RPN8/RPN11